MALPISTKGLIIRYAVEASAGAGKPSTGYIAIPHVTNIGAVNPDPNLIDVTELSETVMHRYIDGLKDLSSAIPLTVNLTSDFITAWTTLKSAADTGYAAGKLTWFEVYSANLGKSFYFSAMPAELGFDEAAVDQALQTTAYLIPNGWAGYDASSSTSA